MGWQPIETAPTDRIIRLRLPTGAEFDAYLVPVEGPDGTCWAWGEAVEGAAPMDWTDGVCWAVNADGEKSTQPVAWEDQPNPRP